LDKIFQAVIADPSSELEVNLPEQMISIVKTGEKESFVINGYKKHNMINGFDDIDYLQAMKENIGEFAAKSIY
jgi:3-isopropylmalate/(R)-2-methylmalate dehydratase small subunit